MKLKEQNGKQHSATHLPTALFHQLMDYTTEQQAVSLHTGYYRCKRDSKMTDYERGKEFAHRSFSVYTDKHSAHFLFS
jgi:hypothetical protein